MDAEPGATFGDLLRRYRLAAGLTQEELAERAHLSARAISDLERGLRSHPWRDTVNLLAGALELDAPRRDQFVAAARQPRSAPSVHVLPPESSPSSRGRRALPHLLTKLIGRDHEIATVTALLRRSDARLLTLTGPGGVGKTVLAVAAAAQVTETFRDGVIFVPLAPINDPRWVGHAIAEALSVQGRADRPIWDELIESVGDRRYLLVLDNFEHLLGASADLLRFVESCPETTVLVTSRSTLGVVGEREFLIPPLISPERRPSLSVEDAARSSAVQLFVDRAQAVKSDFDLNETNAPVVAEICRRLDGLPLALELAAAAVKVLSLRQIADRLADPLRLPPVDSSSRTPRQQTLRATMDWSYNLLTEPEKTLFRRLAIFAGGCGLEAAETVCVGGGLDRSTILDRLVRLVDASLVVVSERDAQARYSLLETMRQYGLERLAENGETESLRERHWDWVLALAERGDAGIQGPEQEYWITTFKTEADNVRAALEWGFQGETREPARLVGCLWRFWYFCASIEGRRWQRALLGRSIQDKEAGAKASLGRAFSLRESAATWAEARALCEESLQTLRELGDERNCGWALNNLGCIATYEGKVDEARSVLEKSIATFRAAGDQFGVGMSLRDLATAVDHAGDRERAKALLEESLAVLRGQGEHWNLAFTLCHLGRVCRHLGENERARELLEEALSHFQVLPNRNRTILEELSRLDRVAGHLSQARARLAQAADVGRDLRDDLQMSLTLSAMGILALAEHHLAKGVRLIGAAMGHIPSTALDPLDRAEQETRCRAARCALGEPAYAVAWAEGQAMTLEQAIADALEEDHA